MPKSTNKRTRAVATRKNERPRSHPYSERVPIITHALCTLGGRAISAELFAALRTGQDGLFGTERRIGATYRQCVRKMEHPPFERDGKYFVLTKRQRRIPGSKSNRKLTRLDREEERSTGRSPRQGFNVPVDARRAIDDLAMKRASEHFAQQGWKVEDVHEREPYDLRCLNRGKELRVEVKGTSSAGSEIVLTRNEVAHARRYFPNVALYVLADVIWKSTGGGGRYRAKGGRQFVNKRWRINNRNLKPISYTYKLPELRPDRSEETPHAHR